MPLYPPEIKPSAPQTSLHNRLEAVLALFPLPTKHGSPVKCAYGTSGIRLNNVYLDNAVVKCALFQILRSASLKNGKALGLIITASHNPADDNGIKLCEDDGSPLDQSWERVLEKIVDQTPSEAVSSLLEAFPLQKGGAGAGVLFLGRDSRPHSDRLCGNVHRLLEAAPEIVLCRDFRYTSTPELFSLVRQFNESSVAISPSEFRELEYHDKLVKSFTALVPVSKKIFGIRTGNGKIMSNDLFVDCANGVGSLLLDSIKGRLAEFVTIRPFNKFREGVVNKNCGAEYVHKHRLTPVNSPENSSAFSLDGDADRIVYFTPLENDKTKCRVLDGDHIQALYALFIKELVKKSREFFEKNKFVIKIVQTAYSNGNATGFIKNLGIEVCLAKTGVKHMYVKAMTADVGVFFEPNGHGTAVFTNAFLAKAREEIEYGESDGDTKDVLRCFLLLSEISNSKYADALTTLLAVPVMLLCLKVDPGALYVNLPFENRVLKVKNKNFIAALANDDSRVLEPAELQRELDAVMAKYERGRCFVRPSGTEDVVRVYAEANKQEEMESLMQQACDIVMRYSQK